MRKHIAALALLFALVPLCGLFAQGLPADWDTRKPLDTDQWIYRVGKSDSKTDEKEAFKEAREDYFSALTASAFTFIQKDSGFNEVSKGFVSEIEDVYREYFGSTTFRSQAPLAGVRELAEKSEVQKNGRWRVRILAAISAADYQRAVNYVDNEAAAFLAYRFFHRSSVDKPAGFDDYTSYLAQNCITVTFKGTENDNTYAGQFDAYIKRLYKRAGTFATTLDGNPARIINDAPRYYDGLLRSLQSLNLFTITRDTGRIILSPLKSTTLASFKNAVAAVPDSSKIFVTGIEVIETDSGTVLNPANLVVAQFKALAARNFALGAVNFTLPKEYTQGDYLDEDGIIEYIGKTEAFPARYVALCVTETHLGPDPGYNIPRLIYAATRFSLYDIVTGEVLPSETASTRGIGAFSPASLDDNSVLKASRSAIQFLYDVKLKPGLADIMRPVLEAL